MESAMKSGPKKGKHIKTSERESSIVIGGVRSKEYENDGEQKENVKEANNLK